jgi:hypothetical protein
MMSKLNTSRILPILPLLHHFIPASLYGGKAAFPTLSKIDRELRGCRGADAAASILELLRSELTRIAGENGVK